MKTCEGEKERVTKRRVEDEKKRQNKGAKRDRGRTEKRKRKIEKKEEASNTLFCIKYQC